MSKIDWARIDATTDADIARHAAENEDTSPIFTATEILMDGRRVAPDQSVDVRALRARLGLSQEGFAARYGFSVATIRQYESNRRKPSGPAQTLLRVIAREPDAVTRALIEHPPLE